MRVRVLMHVRHLSIMKCVGAWVKISDTILPLQISLSAIELPERSADQSGHLVVHRVTKVLQPKCCKRGGARRHVPSS